MTIEIPILPNLGGASKSGCSIHAIPAALVSFRGKLTAFQEEFQHEFGLSFADHKGFGPESLLWHQFELMFVVFTPKPAWEELLSLWICHSNLLPAPHKMSECRKIPLS